MKAWVILFAMSLVSGSAAANIVEAGKAVHSAKGCQGCHGELGVSPSPAAFPHLAGQHASFLEYALRGYRDGSRRNALMNQFAAGLTDLEIRQLAAFYAAQDGLIIPRR